LRIERIHTLENNVALEYGLATLDHIGDGHAPVESLMNARLLCGGGGAEDQEGEERDAERAQKLGHTTSGAQRPG
jgi:hypothetical protein